MVPLLQLHLAAGDPLMRAYLQALEAALRDPAWAAWRPTILHRTYERLLQAPHGDQPRWLAALAALPPGPARLDADRDRVTLSRSAALTSAEQEALEQGLRALMPWRKGPFDFFGLPLDTEWRSDWKWQRVRPHLSPLTGRRVLDVGCGSGYHCWRMAAAGASCVLGIDPTLLFLMQFLSVKRYAMDWPVWMVPLRLEELPAGLERFDTVFSMGVLYHRRSPLDHLLELRGALRPGGELVLETLVVEGDEQQLLMPEDRYAAMRNVYFIPSSRMLERWLRRCGFEQVRTVDEAVTTVAEQRATPWMTFQSLPDFLDPSDPARTREGLPAPRRAVLVARRPA